MEQFIEFAVFAGKLLFVFLFIVGLVLLIATLVMKQKLKPDLQVENLNHKFDELEQNLKSLILDKKALKAYNKQQKEKIKNKEKLDAQERKKIFVLDFDGDLHAHAVEEFRDEVTALLLIATPQDEVVIKIESPGGVVHGYGLAASQIKRLKSFGLKVTACVDLVAASGGYMMACTAHKIVAAPFAIVGSIGVLAQVPNFHRLLKKHDVDYEEISSGEYKRTVSLMGEITEKGRAKFKEQIADTHELFKSFVAEERPIVEITNVATGEYWYGLRAKELKLIDEIMTSDEYLLSQRENFDIYSIRYETKKTLSDKISDMLGKLSHKIINQVYERLTQQPPI